MTSESDICSRCWRRVAGRQPPEQFIFLTVGRRRHAVLSLLSSVADDTIVWTICGLYRRASYWRAEMMVSGPASQRSSRRRRTWKN